MDEKLPVEEVKPKDEKPASAAGFPLWLVTSLVLGLASLISLIYYFFVRHTKEAVSTVNPHESEQAREVEHGLDIIKSKPAFSDSALQDSSEEPLPLETSLPKLSWEKVKPAVAPLLALVIAYFAQDIFNSTTGEGGLHNWNWLASQPEASRLWIGAGVYLAAALIWAWVALPMQSKPARSAQLEPPHPQPLFHQRIRLILLLTSVSAYVLSILLYVMAGENGFIRGLWVTGLICFIFSQIPWLRSRAASHFEAEESPRFGWRNWLVLTLILGAAFWLRFYKLEVLPDDFHGDLASYGFVARDYLSGAQQTIFDDSAFSNTPFMDFLTTYFSMAVFGNNHFGLSMTAVINGMFSLLAVYLLIWRLFDSHRLAALTTALVTINVAHIHFSRIVILMNPWPFGYFALFFLIDGLKARRAASFGLAGVFLGFALQSYFPGRVLVFIIGIFLLYAFFFQRNWITQNKRGLALMSVGVLLAMGPSLAFHIMHLDSFVSRAREVFLFSPGVMAHLLNKYNTDSKFVVLLTQIKLTALVFNQSGDSGTHVGFPHPMFNSLISPLILLGLGLTLRRWKDAGLFLMLVWLGLMSVLGSVLTLDAPTWNHLAGIIPAASLLIAVVFDQIFELAKKTLGTRVDIPMTILMTVFLVVVGYINWNQYYLAEKDNAPAQVMIGRYINSLPSDVTACGILNGPPLDVRETAFLAWPHKLVNIVPDAPDSELDNCTGSSIVWVLSPENVGRLDAIRARWPGGFIEKYTLPRTDYALTFYLINVKAHSQGEITDTNQSPLTETSKSPASASGYSFSLITRIVLGLALFVSLVSVVYGFWVKRRKTVVSPIQLYEVGQAGEVQQGLGVIQSKPVVADPTQQDSSKERFQISEDWTLPQLTWEKVKPAVMPLVALVIAYIAQGAFDSINGKGILLNIAWLMGLSIESRLWLGSGLYVISALIWAFTAPPLFAIGRLSSHLSTLKAPAQHRPLRFFLLLTSAGAYFASILFFLINGENAFIRILWGVGLASFIFAQIFNKDEHPEAEESPRFVWQNWLVLILILAVGFWLRYYRLAILPDDFHGDMASEGWVARDYLLGVEKNIFGYGFYSIPLMGFLPAAFTMAVFGNNIFGLQMSSVIGGTFTLLAVYLLVWRLFDNHRLAALVMIVTAINAAHIHFSRIAAYMDPWTFGCFALFLLVDGLKARRISSLGLAGVFLGFTMQMYFSGRSLIFVIALFLVYAFFFQRLWITQNKYGLVTMFGGMLLAMGPALVSHLMNWGEYVLRTQQVFILTQGALEHSFYKYNTDSIFVVLLTQIRYSLLMFNYNGDSSTQFGFPYPMLNSLISPLLVLGVGAALRHWKSAGMAFSIIWLAIVMVLGSILTIDAPFWPRLVGILPVAALLVALPLEQTLVIFRKIFNARWTAFVVVLITAFLAVAGYATWNQYYEVVKDNGSPSTFTGRYIGRLPLDVTACGILNDPLTVRETSFLAWPRKLVDIAPDAPDSELDNCTGSSIVWAISSENIGRLDAIRARWPGGILDEQYMPKRNYTMTFYLVGVAAPDLQTEKTPDLSVWLVNGISILIALGLSVALVWFIFRNAILKSLRDFRSRKKIVPSPVPVTPRKVETPTSSAGVLDGLARWYGEVTSFTFPVISKKLIVSILLALLAVVLAYFAQTFLDQSVASGLHLRIDALHLDSEGQRQAVAVLIFVIAALLWTFSTTGSGTESSQGQIPQSGRPLQPAMRSMVQMVGISLTLSAMILYVVMEENALVRWLWLAGLVLFLVSLIVKKQSSAVVAQEESPPFRWGHVLILCSVLALAFFLRVYRLYDIPLDLSTDMASVGISARDYLLGVEKHIFGTGWYYYPRYVFLTYTASMWLTGNNLYGMNFGTVIMGTLNVLGSYLFVWRLFDRHRLALLTAVLITINPAHIHFSRIPSYIDPWSLGFLGLFFFVDGLKGRRWTSLALAGLFTGFSFASYPSGRAVLPILAVALASAWFFKRKWITDNYVGFVWMFLGGLVALGPNLIYFIADWDVYMQRSREVIIFNPGVIDHLKYTYNTDSVWMIVWEQVKRSVLQFNYYSDRSAQFFYPYPMFNYLVSPLLILGFGMSLYRWKKPEFLLSISSFVIILVTGSILTNDAPTWCRLVGIMTFAALLIALVLDEFVNLLEKLSLKPLIPLLLAGMALFLAQLGVADWNNYVNFVGDPNTTRPEVLLARYLDSLPDEIAACGITSEYHIDQEEIRFMGWPRQIIVVPEDTAVLTPDLCPSENVVWILEPAYEDRLSEIQTMWSGGTVKRYYTENDWHVFTSYLVPNLGNP